MYVFVILHFQAEEMTGKCIDSIYDTFSATDFRIVVVDNGSSNGSGERLYDAYNSESCHVILSPENQGFARGNNLGYLHAKETWHPDFILIINNDVIIRDGGFLEEVKRIHEETGYDVFGPDILSVKTGLHQNPVAEDPITLEEVDFLISEIEDRRRRPVRRFINDHFISPIRVKLKIRTRLRGLFHINKSSARKTEPDRRSAPAGKVNPVLHGACYVFSSDFIRREDEAFDSRTFLYHEEEILHLKCMRSHYKMIYDPSVQVLHYEDVSTDMSLGTGTTIRQMVKKQQFLDRHMYDSLQVLRQILTERDGE